MIEFKREINKRHNSLVKMIMTDGTEYALTEHELVDMINAFNDARPDLFNDLDIVDSLSYAIKKLENDIKNLESENIALEAKLAKLEDNDIL